MSNKLFSAHLIDSVESTDEMASRNAGHVTPCFSINTQYNYKKD